MLAQQTHAAIEGDRCERVLMEWQRSDVGQVVVEKEKSVCCVSVVAKLKIQLEFSSLW